MVNNLVSLFFSVVVFSVFSALFFFLVPLASLSSGVCSRADAGIPASKAYMRGEEPPIAAAAMEDMLDDLEDATRNLRQAARESELFWLTHHYASHLQRDPRKTFRGAIIKWQNQVAGIAIVMLEDTGLEQRVKVDKRQRLGASVNLRVKEADPVRNLLHFAHLVN